ncbi:SNF2 family N-terminal domain-containing protein [Vararia minispora EC-137]|uniref:SNF2 family N-terminal domain-containing protein n=1 Tax=Vararia minispora EC-137 TaxID=1314806 RepID=A0ACB8QQN4_9AGAM|nr:SNF2 family N-terminal domain-containing protein [Vararia minispora EC-137]
MAANTVCLSCCDQCRLAGPSRLTDADPFASRHLFPAGSLALGLRGCPWSELTCGHTHLDDGWHDFAYEHILNNLENSARDERAVEHLNFLLQHDFIRIRCKLSQHSHLLFFRIYIVPYDLSGVRGRLRQRDEIILKKSRPLFRTILPLLSHCPHEWRAEPCPASGCTKTGILDTRPDTRTLADIYAELDSPMSLLSSQNDPTGVQFPDKINGLQSSLHKYQRETVSSMLYHEMAGVSIPDPLFLPITSYDGTTVFIQPSTLEILRERPQVSRPRGGILCEELGTGKTVMTLATILSTLDQLPSPEPSFSNPIVLTPLSFRLFRGPGYDAARQRAKRPALHPTDEAFPTLLETMIHFIRLNPAKRRQLQNILEQRPSLTQAIRRNVPFYLQYKDIVQPVRGRGKPHDPGPRVVYLTTATLVVVPPNLVAQWVSEIHKHVSSTIRFLVVRDHDDFPSVLDMASEYDIILLSHARFAREEPRFKLESLHSWTLCDCPHPKHVRVPVCTCANRKNVSPLTQIRWKRLVVDEGHVHGTADTRISGIAAKINVERRWLVSGTPTKMLLGLNFGAHGDDMEANSLEEEQDEDELVLQYPPSPSTSVEAIDSDTVTSRVWTTLDREDLRRLHTMIASFLRDERFVMDHQLFKTHVMDGLFNRTGPQPGAISVLRQLMNSVMIRHRIEDVEREVLLPPLYEETVVLDMDPIMRTSYNALQAVVITNAVDSERVDQDYLFHKRNVAFLREVVENMSQLMFWRVDENRYNVDELSHNLEGMLTRAKERNISESDMILLKQAVRHVANAKADKTWAIVQTVPIPEMAFDVDGIPPPLLEAWAEMERRSPQQSTELQHSIMFPWRLSKLAACVSSRPLISLGDLVHAGHIQAMEDESRNQLFDRAARRKGSGKKGGKGSGGDNMGREGAKAQEAAKAAEAPEKISELRREMNASLEWASNSRGDLGQDIAAATAANASSDARKRMLRSSVLSKARILRSRSSKLNFILSEVSNYSPTEKFLIFSKSQLTLAHIADALALARVKFISYTGEMKVENRQQAVTTFETSDTYRVFLMELKHGSHGLNLVSASRIIFCEPVWQADVEAQAIKACHGTIYVLTYMTVKTLVIRGTPEELIVSRRSELKNSNQKQATHFSDDDSVRRFIEVRLVRQTGLLALIMHFSASYLH